MNIFIFTFEAAFKNELDLSKDADGRYTNAYTASLFHMFVVESLKKLKARKQ